MNPSYPVIPPLGKILRLKRRCSRPKERGVGADEIATLVPRNRLATLKSGVRRHGSVVMDQLSHEKRPVLKSSIVG